MGPHQTAPNIQYISLAGSAAGYQRESGSHPEDVMEKEHNVEEEEEEGDEEEEADEENGRLDEESGEEEEQVVDEELEDSSDHEALTTNARMHISPPPAQVPPSQRKQGIKEPQSESSPSQMYERSSTGLSQAKT